MGEANKAYGFIVEHFIDKIVRKLFQKDTSQLVGYFKDGKQ